MVGIERVMDHVAHAVGRDPLEVRGSTSTARRRPEGGPPGAPPRIFRARWKQGTSRAGAPRAGGRRCGDASAAAGRADHALPHAGRGFHRARAGGRLLGPPISPARKAAIAAWNAANPILKRGIALTPVKFGISFTLTWLNQAGALVHVYQDGSIH
jgi:xanthine dehydrogenase large subunit